MLDKANLEIIELRRKLLGRGLELNCFKHQTRMSIFILAMGYHLLLFLIGCWKYLSPDGRHSYVVYQRTLLQNHCYFGCPRNIPSLLLLQSQTYSYYKSTKTFKAPVGISPAGHVLFVSSLYTGSISDTESVEQSGLTKRWWSDSWSRFYHQRFVETIRCWFKHTSISSWLTAIGCKWGCWNTTDNFPLYFCWANYLVCEGIWHFGWCDAN